MNPVHIVDRSEELISFCDRLRRERWISVDTESNGFHAYFERICLIQISTEVQDTIVDPLALEDLTPLAFVLASPDVEKIFHDAKNDIAGLKKDFGFRFRNIFDTAVAAKILGYRRLGLASLLEEFFGVRLEKKWQRCDWGKRPLLPEQIHYARMDTHYLLSLRHLLLEKLEQKGLLDRAREMFEDLCQVPPAKTRFPEDGYSKLRDFSKLREQERRVLKAVYRFRDQEARRLDRAPFRILSNEVLLRLARSKPQDLAELNRIKGMPRSYARGRPAKRLLAVIRRSTEEPRSRREEGEPASIVKA